MNKLHTILAFFIERKMSDTGIMKNLIMGKKMLS